MTRNKWARIGSAALLLTLSLALLLGSLGYRREAPTTASVQTVTEAMISVDGGPWELRQLPLALRGLAPGTPVSLRTVLQPQLGDSVFVQADYTDAQICFDGEKVFSLGVMDNYPAFMKAPGKEIHVVETYGDGSDLELRVDFRAPVIGGSLLLYRPMVGTAKEIILIRSHQYGVSWSLALTQVLGGLALIVIACCLALVDRAGLLFLWLGFFSVFTGAWFFGSNNFAVTIFPDAALLYLTSFTGLFLSPIVLIQFLADAAGPEDPRILRRSQSFFMIFAGLALLLQLLGLLPLHHSAYFFALALPLDMALLTAVFLREWRRSGSVEARRCLPALCVLTLSACQVLLSRLAPLAAGAEHLFQAGVILFLLMMGVLVSINIRESLHLRDQRRELAYEKKLLTIQAEGQTKAALQMVEHERILSRQRHDLRHQLLVIQDLADPGNRRLQDYLEELVGGIPRKPERYCDNEAVNAVVAHYETLCRSRGIECDIRLAVPAENTGISDGELCAIFGNLLENAVEACGRMGGGRRWLCLRSAVANGALSLTLDNSFSGQVQRVGDRFRSSKRDALGVGLSSVQGLAQQHGGDAEFRPDGTVFRSSVYVMLDK